jgi:hypothetical protein
MSMSTISISFPTRQNLNNFMNLINSFTGYTLEGFYPDLQKPQSGRIRITQALPHLQVYVSYKAEGSHVAIDMSYVDQNFDPFKRQRVYDHLLQLANWQGAGISR